jgi:hypothetical protein
MKMGPTAAVLWATAVLLITLDNELPSDLDRLVALRSECFAGRGFHPRLRLIHRIEFGYAETLRCSADNGSSFSHTWTGNDRRQPARRQSPPAYTNQAQLGRGLRFL